jgi:hypothetical protein
VNIPTLIAKFYRWRRIIKQVFPGLVVLATCILLSGPVAFLTLIGVNSIALYKMMGLNETEFYNLTWGTYEPPSYLQTVSMIGGNVKVVMCSGFALFLNIIGVMGLYFWTRTDYKHYGKLWILGLVFVFIATLGLQWLFNYAYS